MESPDDKRFVGVRAQRSQQRRKTRGAGGGDGMVKEGSLLSSGGEVAECYRVTLKGKRVETPMRGGLSLDLRALRNTRKGAKKQTVVSFRPGDTERTEKVSVNQDNRGDVQYSWHASSVQPREETAGEA